MTADFIHSLHLTQPSRPLNLKMFAKSLILSALAAIAVAAPTPAGAPHPKRSTDTYGNMATWYDAETGNAGACGNYLSNDDRFVAVAMNSPIPCGTWLVSTSLSYR